MPLVLVVALKTRKVSKDSIKNCIKIDAGKTFAEADSTSESSTNVLTNSNFPELLSKMISNEIYNITTPSALGVFKIDFPELFQNLNPFTEILKIITVMKNL